MKLSLVAICLFCVISACNVGSSASPKETLTKFLTAMEHGDFTDAKKYASSDSQSFLDMINQSDNGAAYIYKDKDLVVTDKAVINKDRAEIEVKDNSDDQRVNFYLKKESSGWKVFFTLDSQEKTAIDAAMDAVKKSGNDVKKDVDEALDSIKTDLDSSK